MLINVIERIEGEKKEKSKSYKIQTGQQHLKAYTIIFEKHQVPSLLGASKSQPYPIVKNLQ